MSTNGGRDSRGSWGTDSQKRSFPGRYGRRRIVQEYADLEREWYARLADMGFEDIEVYDKNHNTFLRNHYMEVRKKVVRGVLSGSAELMRLAEEWLDVERWPTRNERWRWAAMAKGGWSIDELAARWPVMELAASGLRSRIKRRVERMREYFEQRVNTDEVSSRD